MGELAAPSPAPITDRPPAMYAPTTARIAQLANELKMLERVHAEIMVAGQDYGVIPGTKQPTLLQPGAQKLSKLYNLAARYEIVSQIDRDDFLSFTVSCALESRSNGQFIVSGIGSANSRETRYRYRWESIGKPVPKEYWKTKDPALLGGKKFRAVKDRDSRAWEICEKVPNKEPWDLHNTLLKMAQKRALVAAVLTATAASHLFCEEEAAQASSRGQAPESTNSLEEEALRRDLWQGICELSGVIADARKEEICKRTIGRKAPDRSMEIKQLSELLKAFEAEHTGKKSEEEPEYAEQP